MGELTDWNEPDLSCVIIIRLAVAQTQVAIILDKRVLYLNCAPLEVFAFIPTEFIQGYVEQQQAVCAVLSLSENQWKANYFWLVSALVQVEDGHSWE